jgi:hypothetical protein
MRWALAAVFILVAGVAAAQPLRRYDAYIYDPGDGREIYAFAGGDRAAALEVRSCGDVSIIAEARDLVRELRTQRARDADNDNLHIITISGRRGRTELGPCGAEPEEEDLEDTMDPEDFAEDADDLSIVIIEDLSAARTRNLVRSLDAAPEPIREQVLVLLGL